MNPKKIALIGCGGLGYEIAAQIVSGQAGNYTLCGIYSRNLENTRSYAETFHCTAYTDQEMLFRDQPDFLIEAAGANALKEILEAALEHHIAVIPLSLGVFADRTYFEEIQKLAKEHQAHIYLPSGAVGGFDLMLSASLDSDLSVSIQTEKPPKALSDAPCLENRVLSDDCAETVFSGNALDAISAFPKNVNVAVAVGLATIGADKLSVKVVSNPALNSNRHTINLDGEFGHAKIEIAAKPSSNAHSSKLAAYSVISLLKRLDSWITFA